MQANQSIQLNIQTISGNSGVYIGNQNISVGVSSHSKVNSAVGALSGHARFYRNLSVVYDPDVIDTPIDDRDTHIFAPRYDHCTPNILNANVEQLNSAIVNQNSGIFFGETTITGMDSHDKNNYGMGPTYGTASRSQRNVNFVYDSDTVDAHIDDRDHKAGVFFSTSSPTVVPAKGGPRR